MVDHQTRLAVLNFNTVEQKTLILDKINKNNEKYFIESRTILANYGQCQ